MTWMQPMVEPLRVGTVLNARYRVEAVLGAGSFGATYVCLDQTRDDRCVVEEMTPPPAKRADDATLSFELLDEEALQRLRHQFVAEARDLQRLAHPGLLPARDFFLQFGTAYRVFAYLPRAQTVAMELRNRRRLPVDLVREILQESLTVLHELHHRRMRHFDLRPSNLLRAVDGRTLVVGMGSARAWYADRTGTHTLQFHPGFAAPEMFSCPARRGPATDLYALAATAYAMLTGSAPPPAGMEITPLRVLCPAADRAMEATIMAALSPRYEDRPRSAEQFTDMLGRDPDAPLPELTLEDLDRRRIELRRFRFERRECPACGGVLESPEPLKPGRCPVCRLGEVTRRELSDRDCPHCRVGILHLVRNTEPMAFCAWCKVGRLKKLRWPLGGHRWRCQGCGVTYQQGADGVRMESDDTPRTWAELRTRAGRAINVWQCDACDAQYDEQPDGTRLQVNPAAPSTFPMSPADWARVAAGLPVGSGNAACPKCSADFHQDPETLTLLRAPDDPYRFAGKFKLQPLDAEAQSWLGAGLTAREAGLVCDTCATEFVPEADTLRLIVTEHPRLRPQVGLANTLEAWHRIARGFPRPGQEDTLDEELAERMILDYLAGRLPLDSRRTDLIWRGPATEGAQQGQLVVAQHEVSFGGRFRRKRKPFENLQVVNLDAGVLALTFEDSDVWQLRIEPITLACRLESGPAEAELSDQHLAERLVSEVQRRRDLAGSMPSA